MQTMSVPVLFASVTTKRFMQFTGRYVNKVTIYSAKLGDLAFITVSPDMFEAIKDTGHIVIMDTDKMLYLVGHYKFPDDAFSLLYDGQSERLFFPVDREIKNSVYAAFESILLFYGNGYPRFSLHKIEEFVADKTRKIKNSNIKKEGNRIKLPRYHWTERITLEASEKDVFMDVICQYTIDQSMILNGEIADELTNKLYGTKYKISTEFYFRLGMPYRLTADGSRKPLYNYRQTKYSPNDYYIYVRSIIPVVH